jgi:hypothetical protein
MPPRPPAHVAPYVEALGPEGAVTFLLEFGGAELSLPAVPKRRSPVARLLGIEAALRLSAVAHRLPRRVPTARPWIAAVLRARGEPVAEIARRLHASDVAVRGWIRRAAVEALDEGDGRQGRLL